VPEGIANVAVAPEGEPAGVIVGLTRAEELLLAIDHAIVRTPDVLRSASVTVDEAETAIAGGVVLPLIVKSALAIEGMR
jgi:hypothetical protein